MSGKGDTPRPITVDAETFASNWEAVFGKKQLGLGRAVQASGSNPDYVGSNPTAPAIRRISVDGDYALYCDGLTHFKAKTADADALRLKVAPCSCNPIYIDPVTGAQVDEHWWPGDPVRYEGR